MAAATAHVTVLFTDIEGSTRLWETEPARMADALARHDKLCRMTVGAQGGQLIKMIGDGLHAVFLDPAAAVATTLELQRGMAAIADECAIPFRMRCGLHAGISEVRDGDYFGPTVNRAARIMNAAHGGQILLSQAVVDLGRARLPPGSDLLCLGRVRLRDLAAPVDVWQLLHADLPKSFPPLRSLDSTPNNLPQQTTSFIGREKEIAEITKLLHEARLLTLTGSGGCGKTRLAMHVAADRLEAFPDGIFVVELAPIADPDLVPQSVATVLGVKEERGKPLTQTLTEHLASRRLLLILDNAEHLLAACAQLADAILRRCPQIVLLVSSREGLGIAGERTYRVPSLPMPDPARDATPESLAPYESVRLFVERAQMHLPQFIVNARNAPALASVCYRLDGIPLALELAAARVRTLSVEEINHRLDQRFRLLTGGSRTALPRQQTLRSLVDWSYDLLSATEQALLCRVAVFSGGWTLEAAERVCQSEGVYEAQVLDLLTSLADKSLTLVEDRDGTTRYRLLETVRQYARDRLLESGDGGQWRDRHLAHFLAVAEEAEPHLSRAEQKVWLDRLEIEHDNLRAALSWSSAPGVDPANGLKLAGALFQFWYVRGFFSEGRSALSGLLTAAPDDQPAAPRAKALHGAGAMAWQQGEYAAARTMLLESLAIRRRLEDRRGIAGSLNTLGALAYDQSDYSTARANYEESLAIRRELGDQWGIAASLNNLGNVASEQGDTAGALASYEASLEILRKIGDQRGIAYALNNLGLLAYDRGDYAAASALHEESLAIRRELSDRWGIASSLNNLGDVASAQGHFAAARALDEESLTIQRDLGDRRGVAFTLEALAYVASSLARPEVAARLWGGAERLREEVGSPIPVPDRPRYAQRVADARAALADDTAFDAAWRKGRSFTDEQLIAHALSEAQG